MAFSLALRIDYSDLIENMARSLALRVGDYVCHTNLIIRMTLCTISRDCVIQQFRCAKNFTTGVMTRYGRFGLEWARFSGRL